MIIAVLGSESNPERLARVQASLHRLGLKTTDDVRVADVALWLVDDDDRSIPEEMAAADALDVPIFASGRHIMVNTVQLGISAWLLSDGKAIERLFEVARDGAIMRAKGDRLP